MSGETTGAVNNVSTGDTESSMKKVRDLLTKVGHKTMLSYVQAPLMDDDTICWRNKSSKMSLDSMGHRKCDDLSVGDMLSSDNGHVWRVAKNDGERCVMHYCGVDGRRSSYSERMAAQHKMEQAQIRWDAREREESEKQ
jgi:hypothetical protein